MWECVGAWVWECVGMRVCGYGSVWVWDRCRKWLAKASLRPTLVSNHFALRLITTLDVDGRLKFSRL